MEMLRRKVADAPAAETAVRDALKITVRDRM